MAATTTTATTTITVNKIGTTTIRTITMVTPTIIPTTITPLPIMTTTTQANIHNSSARIVYLPCTLRHLPLLTPHVIIVPLLSVLHYGVAVVVVITHKIMGIIINRMTVAKALSVFGAHLPYLPILCAM